MSDTDACGNAVIPDELTVCSAAGGSNQFCPDAQKGKIFCDIPDYPAGTEPYPPGI
jgi:hypothetical protein